MRLNGLIGKRAVIVTEHHDILAFKFGHASIEHKRCRIGDLGRIQNRIARIALNQRTGCKD
ncbi:hypothetical protein D3C73_1278140 [compost metagenome]